MAAQLLLEHGNDRPDDFDDHPAVFYIESTSRDHQQARGRDAGTSTTTKSSISRNDISTQPLIKELKGPKRSFDTINEYMADTPIGAASALTGPAVPGSATGESDSVRSSPGASLVDDGRQYESTKDRRIIVENAAIHSYQYENCMKSTRGLFDCHTISVLH